MHFLLQLLICLVFQLVLIRSLPIPSGNLVAPSGGFALAYSRRGLSSPSEQRLATEYSHVRQPQVWGGTPANTSICRNPALWTGKQWWYMGFLSLVLVAVYGILAFVSWGILSVDLPKLIVWNRTGDDRRRAFASRVLKVRNRPNWLLLSLLAVSVAISEVLPFFWGHLFTSGSLYSYISTNIVICVSQVGPTFVMPIFHLEVSGRFTWLVRLIMWLSAPVIVVPAYALRRFRRWRKRGQRTHLDGLLLLDELTEFIHLHERGQNLGGTVDDHVGKAMRDLLERQIAEESSSRYVKMERSWSAPFSRSVATSNSQSLLQEGSTTIGNEDTLEPTSIQPHRKEGSTAIEDVPAPGLRKRGERSTEGHETIVAMISMQVPQQAFIKDHSHRSLTSVTNRYVKVGAPNGLLLRRNSLHENSSVSVTPRRYRLPPGKSYRNIRKGNGFITDSFLVE